MYNPNSGDPRLNRFILVSVVLHAVLFFTLPNLSSLLEPDVPGMAGGGVIQVMHVETSVNPRQSPITDRLSQTTVPRVTEPRPQVEAPPQDKAVAQPKVVEVEEPKLEQAKPKVLEEPTMPEPDPTPEPPMKEVPDDAGRGEVLTSPVGPEVVVEAQEREVIAPPIEKRPEPEKKPDTQNSSGSGQGVDGSSDNPGVTESGKGTAQTAPPAPPPPASGSGLHGGGKPQYPKNAEHDGLEGVVFVVIDVSAQGELKRIVLDKSSGYEILDLQALRHIQAIWVFDSGPYDYSRQVAVAFIKEGNRFVTNVEYGDAKWLNAP